MKLDALLLISAICAASGGNLRRAVPAILSNEETKISDAKKVSDVIDGVKRQKEINALPEDHHHKARKLINDADNEEICFVDRPDRYSSDADYYLDPFRANNDRGDWGKCLPEELFGIMCEHEVPNFVNDGQWKPGDGPGHDEPSEQLWLKMKQLHNEKCVHIDLDITPEAQLSFNDFYAGRNKYDHVTPVGGGQLSDVVFTVVVSDRKYYLNGARNPILHIRGNVLYTFDISAVPAAHPFMIGYGEKVPFTFGVTYNSKNVTLKVPLDVNVSSLLYYCAYHVGMGNEIAVSIEAPTLLTVDTTNVTNGGTGLYHYMGRYIYVANPLTWLEASMYCNSLGGALATIRDSNENSQVASLGSNGRKWIGANDLQTEGVWLWTEDGSPVTFTNFNTGEPNNAGTGGEDCIEINHLRTGGWNDNNCNSRMPSVCQVDPESETYMNLLTINGEVTPELTFVPGTMYKFDTTAINGSYSFGFGYIEPTPPYSGAADALATSAVALEGTGYRAISADIGKDAFNEAFAACPVVQYTRNERVHAVYKRISPIPEYFDAYSLFTYMWASFNNILHEDFELYDDLKDLLKDEENGDAKVKWNFCNYDDPDVGFPRDCGKNNRVDNKWFSMPGGRFYIRGITAGASFEVHSAEGCPVPYSLACVNGTCPTGPPMLKYTQGVTVKPNEVSILLPTHGAPSELHYFSDPAIPATGNKITVVARMMAGRRRNLMMEENGAPKRGLQDYGVGTGETGLNDITYDMACVQRYPNNARLAMQMSLYCMTAFADHGTLSSVTDDREYKIAPSCDKIFRSSSQAYSASPLKMCDQDVAADTCTVQATVTPYVGKTCKKYCEGFSGLTCVRANLVDWNSRSNTLAMCLQGREISCDADQTGASYQEAELICTCGAADDEPEHAAFTAAAETLLISTNHSTAGGPPQMCRQDFVAGTVQVMVMNYARGTCAHYCESASLSCYAAASSAHGDCNLGEEYQSCATVPSGAMSLCTCGPPLNPTANPPGEVGRRLQEVTCPGPFPEYNRCERMIEIMLSRGDWFFRNNNLKRERCAVQDFNALSGDCPSVVRDVTDTAVPTVVPTVVRTLTPTVGPTKFPTAVPTAIATAVPTVIATAVPTAIATAVPTVIATAVPTVIATAVPTAIATAVPTVIATAVPTAIATAVPTVIATANPTQLPTLAPIAAATMAPVVVVTDPLAATATNNQACARMAATKYAHKLWNPASLISEFCGANTINPDIEDSCTVRTDTRDLVYLGEDHSATFTRYVYVPTALSWYNAQANCLSMGGWLATSNNEYENSQIAISGGNTARKWIGASDSNVEGTWVWVGDGSPVLYRNFKNGEPNNSGGSEDCAEINYGIIGEWNDRPCADPAYSVCEIRQSAPSRRLEALESSSSSSSAAASSEVASASSGRALQAESAVTQYEYVSTSLTWQEAQANCVRLGGWLVTISSAEENAAVLALSSTGYRWIGLHDTISESHFQWVEDGSLPLYTNWNPGEPNNSGGDEDCTHMYNNGQWNDRTCSARSPSVCERFPTPSMTPTSVAPTFVPTTAPTFYSTSTKSCDEYCGIYPSLKCVGAARNGDGDNDASACDVDAADIVTCATRMDTNYAVCQCAIDAALLAVEEATQAATPSHACINMLLTAEMHTNLRVKDYCGPGDSIANTCEMLVSSQTPYTQGVESCSAFCSNYHGMMCTSAAVMYTVKGQLDCNEGIPVPCGNSSSTGVLKCGCGFMPAEERASILMRGPLMDINGGEFCPAYTTGTVGGVYTTTLNEGDREYQRVTLTVEYDKQRDDGSMVATKALVEQDTNGYKDSYNTYDVEVCEGVESILLPEDPPEKCSFGHRLDGGSNCYGKLEMNFHSASIACEKRGGHLLKIDSLEELYDVMDIFGIVNLGVGLHLDHTMQGMEWDGYPTCKVNPTDYPYLTWPRANNRADCYVLNTGNKNLYAVDCDQTREWICEARRPTETAQDVATCALDTTLSGPGGDLLRDEGGFCLWYLEDPRLTLPDDESGGFRNTEISHHLAFSEQTRTRKYYKLYGELVGTELFQGVYENEANWEGLTLQKVGINSTEPIVLNQHETDDFHCHFSPTNFGISRIYLQQHMLERIYPGAFKKHCFCGYKHLGHLVSRCDCTKNGVRNNNCQKEHRPMLYDATYREAGEYVYCNANQCDAASP